MLGCIAAVRETESPSQLSPALIQRMWIVWSSAGSEVAASMRGLLGGDAEGGGEGAGGPHLFL
ncbi:hypothetical protein, partial [Streptomyces katrae]|uniref:hypothetical protein n=1 Tax=Streptomyces katrae TaxID=68223 RepID=UPI001FE16007